MKVDLACVLHSDRRGGRESHTAAKEGRPGEKVLPQCFSSILWKEEEVTFQ